MPVTRRGTLGFFVLLLFFAAVIASPSSLAGDCKADVTAALFGQKDLKDATEYVWKVDVSTREECAKVQFSLTYTQTDAEGNDQLYRVPMTMKVRDGSTTSRKVSHRIDRRSSMADWRFEVTGCRPCGGV